MFKYLILIILVCFSCKETLFDNNHTSPIYNYDCLWKEIDRHYPFFEYSHLNWDSVYTKYKAKINDTISDKQLFGIFSKVVESLKDPHSIIFSPYGVGGNIGHFNKFRLKQVLLTEAEFDFFITNRIFDYGILKNQNIGYIKIKTFDGNNQDFEDIDKLLASFSNTKGLIIDIRSNRGGLLKNCISVASRFIDTTRVIGHYRVRNGPEHNNFTKWEKIYISPAPKSVKFPRPVAILTNRYSFSAAEYFVLSLRIIPKITVIGDTTGGGSSPTYARELPNGWILVTSNRQTQTPEGKDFQFTGLYPDIPVWITNYDESKDIDTILKTAIDWVNNQP
jgi:hypothetical protein